MRSAWIITPSWRSVAMPFTSKPWVGSTPRDSTGCSMKVLSAVASRLEMSYGVLKRPAVTRAKRDTL